MQTSPPWPGKEPDIRVKRGNEKPYMCVKRGLLKRPANTCRVSDVAWENLQYGLGNRRLRSSLVVIVAVCLLAGSFTVILIAQIYQVAPPIQHRSAQLIGAS